MAIEIRPPQSTEEIKAAFALVRALAAHEGALDGLLISEEAFINAATGEHPDIHILIAQQNGDVVGVCTFTERFHIWNGTRLIELDDLYVAPQARGLGLGTHLLHAVGSVAKKRDIPVKWQVNTDNSGAINLYRRIGADVRTSGICFWRPENMKP